jgi:formate dehydrogenase beta subunit
MSQPSQSGGFPARFNDITWYRTNVPCMEACPVHTDSGRYVQLVAEGRYDEAFLVARSPNPLASICGRVCAAPCEDACRRGKIDEAVTIRALKRFVCEQYGAESPRPDSYRNLLESPEENDSKEPTDVGCQRLWHLPQLSSRHGSTATPSNSSGRKVAVIGGGPAGLGCAHDLAVLGYDVSVFEALDHAGGMLRYGIPEYRLPRGVIEREAGLVEALGARFQMGTPLTADNGISHLREQGYEAFFVSVGAMRGRDLKIPGSDKDGVVKAVDYLLNINRGYRVDLGDKVIVIGGGSVALDAARTAIRDIYSPMEEIEKTASAVIDQPAMDAARGALRGGASEVHVVSLESMAEMPAAQTVQGQEELHGANEEGIHLHPSWGPEKILGENEVTGVGFISCSRVFDETGRFSPEFDESRKMSLEANSVILAIGQQADFSFLREEDHVELTPAGTVKINPATLATTSPGIFAGGDAAFGPRIAIEAVANGKAAARSIHEYLGGSVGTKTLHVDIGKVPANQYRMPTGYEKLQRETPSAVEIDRRTGITEVENVLTEETAITQAERCLACHIDTIYDPHLCVLCGRCADVCPEKCLVFVPIDQVDMPDDQKQAALKNYGHDPEAPLTVLLKDDTACIRCGLCAARCPTEAMTMERFNFVEVAE